MYAQCTLHHSISSAHVVVDNAILALCCSCTCTYIRTYVHPCRLVRLPLCAFYPLCLSLQTCEDGGGPNVFGIGSVDSAQMGDVNTSDWTFTMSYSNAQQAKTSHVAYKLATSGGTQFSFISESPPNTYVSCCLSIS